MFLSLLLVPGSVAFIAESPISLGTGYIKGRVVRVDTNGLGVVGDSEVVLTAKEFDLLHCLMGRPGRVFSRDRLLEEVWGSDIAVTSRTVDTHLKRLREKLGPAGALIETVRGVGYRFAE